MEQKANVYNPIKMFNTVGQEVESIFIAMNKDVADFMPIDKLRAKTKFSEKEISRLCKKLDVGEDHAKFVRNFQENYETSKKKAAVSFKESKKAFTKLNLVGGRLPVN